MTRDLDPTRAQIEATEGPLLLEFGASWCGHCRALAPKLQALLEQYPEVNHLRIEDGPGRRLGRAFGVKLWPNLVFLRDGRVLRQLARPEIDEVRAGLEVLSPKD